MLDKIKQLVESFQPENIELAIAIGVNSDDISEDCFVDTMYPIIYEYVKEWMFNSFKRRLNEFNIKVYGVEINLNMFEEYGLNGTKEITNQYINDMIQAYKDLWIIK